MVRQFRDTDWETAFSGVPGLVVVRILLCVSTILESSAVPGDFSVAFMSTPLHDAEFIEPPIEAESDSRYAWKLRKALKKASQLFSNYLSDILVDKLGFEKCSLVPTAFYQSVVTPGVKRAAPAPDSQEARPLSSDEHSTYRQGVGKLQFIVERRPDLLYPLKETGRQLANPREFDMIGLKRIMRYISGTENYKLFWK